MPDRSGIGIELRDEVIERSRLLLPDPRPTAWKHPTFKRRDGALAGL